MRPGQETPINRLDWRSIVAPGDLVVWGQASAEPTSLTRTLTAARATVGGFKAFIGISWSDSVDPVHSDHIAFVSYCGTGRNRLLGDRLEILPVPYGQLAAALAPERPVLLLALAPEDGPDGFSVGAGADYVADLLPRARLVIAEVSSRVPATVGGARVRRDQIDIIVRTDGEPPSAPAARAGDADVAVARQVARLVEDGSTLQIGLGAIPAASVALLRDRRDLGLHSGLAVDEIADLVQAGVLTNLRKTVDHGTSVTGLLAGGARVRQWAHGNPALAIRPTSYTHDPAVLRAQDRFVAVNSAIEVDLTGQVNAEVAGGRYVGAVGGAGVFLRGAHESHGGLPIIALPSTAGDRSRIVVRLNGPVSTARADAGIIVTEFGAADLRGLTVGRRREAMIGIAHPDHQAALEREMGALHG